MKPPPPFIVPFALDDAGLTPKEFRVLANLHRRAGMAPFATVSANGIAITCGLSKPTVLDALDSLERRGAIRREGEYGQRAWKTYIIPVHQWASTGQISLPVKDFNRSNLQRGTGKDSLPKGDNTKERAKALVTLPFVSPEFVAAWTEWEKHCREKRKTITESSRARQFKTLSSMGEPAAIGAIHYSIEKNWAGIFPPKALAGNGSCIAPTPDRFKL